MTKYYHVSDYPDLSILTPRVPETAIEGEEDTETKRVCFSLSIVGCLRAIFPEPPIIDKSGRHWIKKYYVYEAVSEFDPVYPTEEQVSDCKHTSEVWSLEPVTVKRIKTIVIDKDIVLPEGITESGEKYYRHDYLYSEYHEKDPEVKQFLGRFHISSDIDEVFTCGCCYWFAMILNKRFADSTIMYDRVMNHFGTMIDDKIYDITGDITNKYDMVPWYLIDDPERSRIIRDCINF